MTKLSRMRDFRIRMPPTEILLAARRGLSEADAAAFDARLVLILANQIGDLDVLEEAVTLARSAGRADRQNRWERYA